MEILSVAENLQHPEVIKSIPQLALAAIAAGGSLLKGVGGLLGAGQAKRQAKKQLGDLKSQRVRALSQFGDIEETVTTGYEDYIAQLGQLPELQIDRSLADRALEQSRERMIGAGGGRVAGEELLREEARRTTAGQIEAARAAVGDGAGLLGAISLAGMSEAGRMREIDIQTQRQRERELLQAQSAYESGLISRAEFERQAGLAEFEAESLKERSLASAQLGLAERKGELGFQRMGIEKEFNQALAAQQAAIAQARAQQIQAGFSMVGDAATSFSNFAAAGQGFGGGSNKVPSGLQQKPTSSLVELDVNVGTPAERGLFDTLTMQQMLPIIPMSRPTGFQQSYIDSNTKYGS